MKNFNKKYFEMIISDKNKTIVICFFAKWHCQMKKTLCLFSKLSYQFKDLNFIKIETNNVEGNF